MTAFNPPRKRKREKRENNREFPAHRRFVKGHRCCIPGCLQTPIEFAHLRTAANSGTGLKPPDWYGIPLCRQHHAMAHSKGHDQLGVDLEFLFKTASWLAWQSPDKKMRMAMKEVIDGR